MKTAEWIFCIFCVATFAYVNEAGECCDSYYDLTFEYHDQKWCDDYCCGTSALGVLDCCDNIFLVAPADDRVGFCTDYFVQNIWAPILIAVGGIGVILTCICCCYCLTMCSQKSSGTVVAPAHQPYHTNVMMLNPTSMQSNPPGYGAPFLSQQPGNSSLPLQNPGYNPSGDVNPVHPPPGVSYPVPSGQQTETKHPFET